MFRKVSLTAALTLAIAGLGSGIANAAPATSFGDGDYIVGVDIAPGTYVGSGTVDDIMGCYWERLSGTSGEYEDIIAMDYTHSPKVIVTIKPTDVVFSSTDCGTWTPAPAARPQARPAPAAPAPEPAPAPSIFGS
ncbi:hypothetical protein JWS13_37395 [Rhodococcus pseudokoreensis]|uniref:Secreted protein n=1 Tax=Rhodococcus pseudokoreensis TaxID=2811421 RepID=A0A974WAR1_9NOCA|nr:hypothetical protein JWS13_37395 [Rhodococcus pseudokoreensis]